MSDLLTYNPWHGDPAASKVPVRPSLAQLGGAAYQNDANNVPDLDTMPSAEMENANEWTLAGVARVCPVAIISIAFASGTPGVDQQSCVDPAIVDGTFTVTDNGAGDTSITWPADTFPVPAAKPHSLTLNGDVDIDRMRAIPISNGVRVKTFLGAVATDCDFTVCIG